MQRGLRPGSADYDQRLPSLRDMAAKIGLTDGLGQAQGRVSQCCNAWLLTKTAKAHTHEHTLCMGTVQHCTTELQTCTLHTHRALSP